MMKIWQLLPSRIFGESRPDLGGTYLPCFKCKASTAQSSSCLSLSHALTDFRHWLTGSAVPSFKTKPQTFLSNSNQTILEISPLPPAFLNVTVSIFEAETEVISLKSKRIWVVETEDATWVSWCWFGVLSVGLCCPQQWCVQCSQLASVFGFIVTVMSVAHLVSCYTIY